MKCANCQIEVKMILNKDARHGPRYEPTSHYWKGGNSGKEIEEVYCSPKCSLDKHEKDKGKYHEGDS